MLTEYMFSPTPTDDVREDPISRSSVLGAAAVAWAISLLRLALAVSHHEIGADASLAALAAVVIPWVTLAAWRVDDSRFTPPPTRRADEIPNFARRLPQAGHLRSVSQRSETLLTQTSVETPC